MTWSQFCKRVAKKSGYNTDAVRDLLSYMPEVIWEALAEGEKVSLLNVCVIDPYIAKGRTSVMNTGLKAGEKYTIPDRVRLQFRTSKILDAKLKTMPLEKFCYRDYDLANNTNNEEVEREE